MIPTVVLAGSWSNCFRSLEQFGSLSSPYCRHDQVRGGPKIKRNNDSFLPWHLISSKQAILNLLNRTSVKPGSIACSIKDSGYKHYPLLWSRGAKLCQPKFSPIIWLKPRRNNVNAHNKSSLGSVRLFPNWPHELLGISQCLPIMARLLSASVILKSTWPLPLKPPVSTNFLRQSKLPATSTLSNWSSYRGRAQSTKPLWNRSSALTYRIKRIPRVFGANKYQLTK